MTSRNQHVTKRGDGSWQVKGEGASRAYRVTRTQAEAIDIARGVTRNQGSELFIHRPDGKIRARDSHGRDPFPPHKSKSTHSSKVMESRLRRVCQ